MGKEKGMLRQPRVCLSRESSFSCSSYSPCEVVVVVILLWRWCGGGVKFRWFSLWCLWGVAMVFMGRRYGVAVVLLLCCGVGVV